MKKVSAIFFSIAAVGLVAVSWTATVPNGRVGDEHRALEPYYWGYPALFLFYVFVAYCVFRPYNFLLSWKRAAALAIITSVFAWFFIISGMHQPLVHYYFIYILMAYFLLLVCLGLASIFIRWRSGNHL